MQEARPGARPRRTPAGSAPCRGRRACSPFCCVLLAPAVLSAAPGDAIRSLPPEPAAAVVLRAADRWLSGLARSSDLDRVLVRSGALRAFCTLAGEGGAGETRILDAIAAAGEIGGALAGDVAFAAADSGRILAIEVRAGEEAAVLERLRNAGVIPARAIGRTRPGLLIAASSEEAAKAAGARIDRVDPPGRALAIALAGSADTAIVAFAPGLPSMEIPIRAGLPGRPLVAAPIETSAAPEPPAGGRTVLQVPDLQSAWEGFAASCVWSAVRAPDTASALRGLAGLLAGGEEGGIPPQWDPAAAELCIDLLAREVFPGDAMAAFGGGWAGVDLTLAPAARVAAEIARRFGLLPEGAAIRGDRLEIRAGNVAPAATAWRFQILDGGAVRIVRGGAGDPAPGLRADLGEGEIAALALAGPPADALRRLLPLPSLERLDVRGLPVDAVRISIIEPPPGRFLATPDVVAVMRTRDNDAAGAALESLAGASGSAIRLRGDPPVTDRTHRGILLWKIAGLPRDIESFWEPVSAHLDGVLLLATSPGAAMRAIDEWLDGGRSLVESSSPACAALAIHADRLRTWALSAPSVSWALANRFGLERRDAIERAIRAIHLPLIVRFSASGSSSAWSIEPAGALPARRPAADRRAWDRMAAFDPPRTERCALLGEQEGRIRRAVIASAPVERYGRCEVRLDGETEPSWSARVEPEIDGRVRIRVERSSADPALDLLWTARAAASVLARRPDARAEVIVEANGATRILTAEAGPLGSIRWAGMDARAWRISVSHPDHGRATLWVDGRRRVLLARTPGWEAELEAAGSEGPPPDRP